MSALLKILVVANPGDQAELVSLLRAAGSPVTEARLVTGVGDDATFARFVAERPTLALVGATLERGDSRALIDAMRAHTAPSPMFVVLIGDVHGPVHSALDALDLGGDRFVGRPLTVKALRFAVLSGLGQGGPWGAESAPAVSVQALAAAAMASGLGDRRTVRLTPVAPAATPVPALAPAVGDQAAREVAPTAAGEQAAGEPAAPAPAPTAVVEPVSSAVASAPAAVDEAAVTQPMRVAELRARWEALAEELDQIPDDELDDRPTLRNLSPVSPVSPVSPSAPPPPWAGEVDDGESGEIQVVEPDDEAVAELAARAAWSDGEVVAVSEAELAAERALAAGDETANVTQGMLVAAFDHAADDELVGTFEPPAAPASGPGAALAPGLVPVSAPDPVAVPGTGSHRVPAPDPLPTAAADDAPAEIAVHETASVVLIPESEIWAPPEEAELAAMPVREPTMILTDDPPPMSPAGPPPSVSPPPSTPVALAPPALVALPRSVTIPPPLASAAPPSQPQLLSVRADAHADDGLPFDDDFDVADELDADEGFAAADAFDQGGLEPLIDAGSTPAPAPAPAPRPDAPPPAGGEFARELRRKMSAMAERLFRGEVPAVPVDRGPGHDHHTEIDLRGLDEETPLPAAALTDDLAGATYVGELPAPDPQGPDSRGTAEVGELRRGTADVPALVARMFSQSFTGRVVFKRGAVEKAIFFDAGRPVFASSSQLHDRMGELLHREGKITREQHDRCDELVRDTGRRMGELLVERGYLKRRELLPAVRRHIEDIIYSLFAWDSGEYRVVAGDGAGGERIRLARHAAAIILEGVRRKLDHDLLEQLLGPPGTVVVIVDRDKLGAVTAVADLSREERAALAALDGVADLEQVARASGAGLESAYQLAWSLSLLGLVAPRRREEDDEAGALVGESDLRIDRERVQARCELCADADYFALLGVRRDATGFEIRRAYEAARRDFASESFPLELRRELAADLEDIALVLDEAYRVLRDDPLRSAYRAHLRDIAPDAA